MHRFCSRPCRWKALQLLLHLQSHKRTFRTIEPAHQIICTLLSMKSNGMHNKLCTDTHVQTTE
jgi:hypothetical protein